LLAHIGSYLDLISSNPDYVSPKNKQNENLSTFFSSNFYSRNGSASNEGKEKERRRREKPFTRNCPRPRACTHPYRRFTFFFKKKNERMNEFAEEKK